MDIIDILIARAKSFTGETKKLVKDAQDAMEKANSVAAMADEVEAARDDAIAASEAAQSANETAQASASELEELKNDVVSAAEDIVDTKIEEAITPINEDIETINFSLSTNTVNDVRTDVADDLEDDNFKQTVIVVDKGETSEQYVVEKNYTTLGDNEDGSMTQKAITELYDNQSDMYQQLASNLETLEETVENIGTTGGGNISGDIGSADDGTLIVSDGEGGIRPGDITEESLILDQVINGIYAPKGVVGLEIDYENKTYKRLAEAIGKTAGTDFDSYNMFGGRKRVKMANDGTVSNYLGIDDTTDKKTYQVMVEQPAFYFMRVPLKTTTTERGTRIDKEAIYLSDVMRSGFTKHPVFGNNDQIYFGAFEGSIQIKSNNTYLTDDEKTFDTSTDMLSSTSGVRPLSLTMDNLSSSIVSGLASHRGANWRITNIFFESMNQMLMAVEFGTLNIQTAFYRGIVDLGTYNFNSSCLTGATDTSEANQNKSFMADTDRTVQIVNNTRYTYSTNGSAAITYRGMENPYGNMWRFVGYQEVTGNGANGEYMGLLLPNSSTWISAFHYDEDHPELFIPIINEGTSALPVGDYCYIDNVPVGEIRNVVVGGCSFSNNNAGPFYYGFDVKYPSSNYGARLMYAPADF